MRQAVKSEVKRGTSVKVRRKKIHPRQMLAKSRNTVFFQWFVCRVSRKVGLLKRRVRREVLSQEIKNCTPLWRKAHSQGKMLKKLTVSEHFLKFGCRNNACRCDETRSWKWKCQKTGGPGALFEVQMSKKCTPLWRNAHLEVNILKNWWFGSTFWSSDVAKLHELVAKRTFWSKNVQNTSVSEHFSNIWCAKIARRCGEKHFLKSKCPKHVSSGQFLKFWCRKISQVVS